jgi:hypothetical protein
MDVKMLKAMAGLIGIFMQTFAGSALAQSGVDDLAGRWTVAWPNNSKNTMLLTSKNGRLSGTYEDDDKDACSVTGNFQVSNRHLAFQIVCPKWDIRMQGIAAQNGKIISGSYQAFVDGAGQFTMAKQ